MIREEKDTNNGWDFPERYVSLLLPLHQHPLLVPRFYPPNSKWLKEGWYRRKQRYAVAKKHLSLFSLPLLLVNKNRWRHRPSLFTVMCVILSNMTSSPDSRGISPSRKHGPNFPLTNTKRAKHKLKREEDLKRFLTSWCKSLHALKKMAVETGCFSFSLLVLSAHKTRVTWKNRYNERDKKQPETDFKRVTSLPVSWDKCLLLTLYYQSASRIQRVNGEWMEREDWMGSSLWTSSFTLFTLSLLFSDEEDCQIFPSETVMCCLRPEHESLSLPSVYYLSVDSKDHHHIWLNLWLKFTFTLYTRHILLRSCTLESK